MIAIPYNIFSEVTRAISHLVQKMRRIPELPGAVPGLLLKKQE